MLIVSYSRMIVRMSRSIMVCEDEAVSQYFSNKTGSINICEHNLTHALTFIDLWIGISEVLLDNQLQLTKISASSSRPLRNIKRNVSCHIPTGWSQEINRELIVRGGFCERNFFMINGVKSWKGMDLIHAGLNIAFGRS